MKLAAKLTITLVLGIVAVMGIYAWVQIASEVVLSEGDARRARRNGLAWLGTIESARAREVIELSGRRVGRPELTLRIVSFDSVRPDLSADDIRVLETGEVVRRAVRDDEGRDWLHGWVAIKTAAHPMA